MLRRCRLAWVITPCLILSTSWTWWVSFTHWQLYPMRISARNPLDRKLDGRQNWSNCMGKKVLLLTKIEPNWMSSGLLLAAVVTELSWSLKYFQTYSNQENMSRLCSLPFPCCSLCSMQGLPSRYNWKGQTPKVGLLLCYTRKSGSAYWYFRYSVTFSRPMCREPVVF